MICFLKSEFILWEWRQRWDQMKKIMFIQREMCACTFAFAEKWITYSWCVIAKKVNDAVTETAKHSASNQKIWIFSIQTFADLYTDGTSAVLYFKTNVCCKKIHQNCLLSFNNVCLLHILCWTFEFRLIRLQQTFLYIVIKLNIPSCKTCFTSQEFRDIL